MNSRLDRLRGHFSGIDGMVIMRPENRSYLSGFTGSAGWLLITADKAYLLTDFRYVEQAEAQATDFTVVRHDPKIIDTLSRLLAPTGVKRLGFEADYTTYRTYSQLREKLEGVELVGCDGLVEKLRMVKDGEEVANIREAVRIADAAYTHVLTVLQPGVSEKDVALELEFFMRRQGAEKNSFDPIVVSGPRSSLPHGEPTERKLEAGEAVTMDFGTVYRGYCSDLTRTVFIRRVSERQKEIYGIVLRAQLAALEAIGPGRAGDEVDEVARAIIRDSGYGDYFGHGLGHSVGRQIHENPRLSVGYKGRLEPGMVATVEPGIYLPGWGGVRIEDMVLITKDGADILTRAPKQLTVI